MRGIRILLGISGVLAVVVSLALMLGTKGFFAGQGIELDDKLALIGMAQGSILLGLGVINLMMMRSSDTTALRAVMAGNLVTHVAALAVNAHAIAGHLVGNQVWGDVGMHAAFGLAFAVFLLRSGASAKQG